MKLKELIKVIELSTTITICYAGTGSRIYKGCLTDIPEHALNYYVTYISPSKPSTLYIEVHENKNFLED